MIDKPKVAFQSDISKPGRPLNASASASFIRFCPVVVKFGRGIANSKLCWNSSFLTKSYDPNFGPTTKPIPRYTTSIQFFHCRKFHSILPRSCGVRSRNSKLKIVLKFLIFYQVVRPQFWSHDKTNTQVHNFNIYSFIVESLIRFCPVVLELGRGIETHVKSWQKDRQTDRRTDTDQIVPRYRATRRAGD